MGERGGTGGEVGVDVGLEDMRDGEGVGAGVFEIGLDVADGVDDDSLPPAREDVGVRGQAGDFEALDLHLAFLLLAGLMMVLAAADLVVGGCRSRRFSRVLSATLRQTSSQSLRTSGSPMV